MTEPPDAAAPDISPETAHPRNSGATREPISDDTLELIRQEIERTGTGAMRLLRGRRDKPAGLTAGTIDGWLYGSVKNAIPAHVDYMIQVWASLPTDRLMKLTSEMSAALEAEFLRTGMGAVTLLKRGDDLPSGLTRQVVLTWLNQTTRTVSENHWDYIWAKLRAMPDNSSARSGRAGRAARQEIAASDLAELRQHRERTGIGGGVLLRNAADKPAGLTPAMISNWLSGASRTANPEHIAYILTRYRAWK